VEAAAIAEIFDSVLESFNLDSRCVAGAGSIDLKKSEAGLLSFCESRSIPSVFFSADDLQSVQGGFSGSDFVKETTGVDNVCERAAVLASGNGSLLIKKTARNGVSIAAAAASVDLHF
jgi:cobalt-precorrin 5A hydrolase